MSGKRQPYRVALLLLMPLIVFAGLSRASERIRRGVATFDLVITSGRVLDGTGNPWTKADIGIKDGRVARIGRIPAGAGAQVIDADGLYVAPGFIDVHTHADRLIASQTDVANYLLQGVTTLVGGNCGGSQYPLQQLFDELQASGIALNFASLVGHNTVRRKVMGNDDRIPSPEELSKMQSLVKQEMLAGAIGLSTGLSYVPGRYSTTEEIAALARMVQPFEGLYATHMRNQGLQIKEAIEEAIRIGREAGGIPVQISHIKLAHEAVWGNHDLVTGPIEEARRKGFQVLMDQYPYTATSSGFASSFPGWAVAGGNDAFAKRLNDPEAYARIRQAIIEKRLTSARGRNPLETIYVTSNKNHPEYEGSNLAQILELTGREVSISNGADLIIEMQKDDHPRGVFFQMAEDDVAALMREPYNMIASDGKIEIPGIEVPHPRAYGTFPRVLARYVRGLGVLTLEDAIRKMSSLPAQAMGFEDRGLLCVGSYADVVVFDLDRIEDTATFEEPHQYPKGIEYVIVNGEVAARNGAIVTKDAGIIIYGHGRAAEEMDGR
jgi:N-acyl-D-amino-acid deacylase